MYLLAADKDQEVNQSQLVWSKASNRRMGQDLLLENQERGKGLQPAATKEPKYRCYGLAWCRCHCI
jgi:hypothetical protein